MNETPSETAPTKRSSVRRWVLFAIVLLVVVDAFVYWRYSQNWESTDDAQIDGRIHEISARVSGTVVKLYVEDNQSVEQGELLAELDAAGYQAAVDAAEAAVAEAEADAAAAWSQVPVVSTSTSTQLSGAEASVVEVQTAIATAEQQAQAARAQQAVAEARVRQAKANQERTAADVERYRPLAAKEQISRQQFDAAESEATAASAELDAAEAQLEEVRQAIDVADRQVAQQKARLPRAESDVRSAASGPQQVAVTRARAEAAAAKVQTEQARLTQAKIDLGHTKIYAPVSGVLRRNIEIGQGLQMGQLTFAIVPLDDIWVLAHFKENQLAHIRPGQPVEVSVDAYEGRKYEGHVDSISPATGARFSLLPPENSIGNYVKVVQRVPVKIVLEEGQGAENVLRPGMSVVPRVRVQ